MCALPCKTQKDDRQYAIKSLCQAAGSLAIFPAFQLMKISGRQNTNSTDKGRTHPPEASFNPPMIKGPGAASA